MRLRIWHGCVVVAEIEIGDDDLALPGRMAFRGTEPHPEVVGFTGSGDHISLDPWAKLVGETVGKRHSVSVPFGLEFAEPPHGCRAPAHKEPAKTITAEKPLYYKIKDDSSGATALWVIRVDEGWRDTIVCSGMYEWAADWLLEQLASRPKYGRPE